jgi:hypothetical protein
MLKFSTKLLNVVNDAIRTSLAAGAIYVYSGTQPVNANAAPTGTLLGIATVSAGAWTAAVSTANGLDFAVSSAGVLSKSSSETWQFVGLADGTAGWFRFVSGVAADSLTDDVSTYPRIDGRISTSGAEMRLSSLSIVQGATTTIDSCSISWPASLQ